MVGRKDGALRSRGRISSAIGSPFWRVFPSQLEVRCGVSSLSWSAFLDAFCRTCFSLTNGFMLPFLILFGTMIFRNEFLFPASFVSRSRESLGFQDRNLSSDHIGFGGLYGDPEVIGL